MPTPDALSLEQRGALRWQVPADPQQAGSRPPIGPGVARHASRLRRTGRRGLRGVLFPSPTPATLSGPLSQLSRGLTWPLPHQPLSGGLLHSFCSILRAPAPPAPNSCSCVHPAPSTLSSPGTLAWLFPPKALLSWPPRTQAARGGWASVLRRDRREQPGQKQMVGHSRWGPAPQEPAGRARPAGVDRWRGCGCP